MIDYSISMIGERDSLMRKELTKSVGALSGGVKYQMIYFSGPAWVAGSEMPGFNYNSGKATVKGKGGHKYEWTGKGLHDWTPKGKRQPVEWIEISSSNLAESLDIMKKTPLSGGDGLGKPAADGHRYGAAATDHLFHDRWRGGRTRHAGTD